MIIKSLKFSLIKGFFKRFFINFNLEQMRSQETCVIENVKIKRDVWKRFP